MIFKKKILFNFVISFFKHISGELCVPDTKKFLRRSCDDGKEWTTWTE